MRKHTLFVLFLVALFTLPILAQTPEQANQPAKYLWIQNVVVPEGKAMTYPGMVAEFRHAADTIKSDAYWLAASNLTGDMRRAVYITGCNSFGEMEKKMAAFDKIANESMQKNANFHNEMAMHEMNPQAVFAKYRADLSYQPTKIPPANVKFWTVTTMFLNPGQMSDFADMLKEKMDLMKKADIDTTFQVYEVVAGLPTTGSAYYVVMPMKSLADLDVEHATEKAKGVFTPEVLKHFETINRTMFSKVETTLMMVRPDLSRPPQNYLAANPEFWTVKEAAPAMAKKGKKPQKPVEEALKEMPKK